MFLVKNEFIKIRETGNKLHKKNPQLLVIKDNVKKKASVKDKIKTVLFLYLLIVATTFLTLNIKSVLTIMPMEGFEPPT